MPLFNKAHEIMSSEWASCFYFKNLLQNFVIYHPD